MICTKCGELIKRGEKYYRTHRGSHHEACAVADLAHSALVSEGIMAKECASLCAELDAAKEREAALTQQRDEMAAALAIALHRMACPMSDCKECDAFVLYDQPSAILAARDTRMRSEGAAEALESRARTALMFAAIAKDQAVIDYLNAAAGADQQLAAAKRQEAKG